MTMTLRHEWHRCLAGGLFLALVVANHSIARADALVVTRAAQATTIAEIYLEEKEIRTELEVGAADIAAFLNILPDELYERFANTPRPTAERQAAFFSTDWVTRADGKPLKGTLVQLVPGKRIQRDQITGQPLAKQPDDAELVLRMVLRYKLDKRPASITFRPPLQEGTAVTNVGFVCYHAGVPVNDFRYLSAEFTLDLDWDDPWYSRFRHRNLKRQFDAPLSVFLYVEPFEIRKEVIVRPKDLQAWVDLGLAGKPYIEIEAQQELKTRAAAFLDARAPVVVDGETIVGELDRIHFLRRSLRTTGVVDPPERLDVNTATLGAIFVYPTDRLPESVKLTWDLFSPKIQTIPASATDEAGSLPSELSPDFPDLSWQNFLTNPTSPEMLKVTPPQRATLQIPVLSFLCFGLTLLAGVLACRRSAASNRAREVLWIGGASVFLLGLAAMPIWQVSLPDPFSESDHLDQAELQTTVHALLFNVYRAFDRRHEDLVYDQLARSIAGDLLTDVYLQMRESMELENQGGAKVKVDSVELLELQIEEGSQPTSPTCHCRWIASGSVGHWGHIHRRTNQYDALLTIQPVDNTWKITDIELREEIRVAPAP